MYPADAFYARKGKLAGLHSLGFRSERLEIPIPVFVIEHPSAGLILVDTGFHSSVAVDPRPNMGPIFGRLMGSYVTMRPEEAVPDQLRERGIDPGAVRYVVMTHLHFDHASGVSQFPDATFVISRREWESAKEGKLTLGYLPRQFDHAFDWRTVDFDGPDVSSFRSFGRSLDLFGDGSVRLLYTPGHTLGHMSVVARVRDGEVLMTIDAAYSMRTIRESAMPYGPHDEHEFRRSLREVQRYVEQTPGAIVVPGHDLDAFRSLKPVYD
jgi:glyoxylase-like metal-dependent hydrolase (beta-lactamase superfamily II)